VLAAVKVKVHEPPVVLAPSVPLEVPSQLTEAGSLPFHSAGDDERVQLDALVAAYVRTNEPPPEGIVLALIRRDAVGAEGGVVGGEVPGVVGVEVPGVVGVEVPGVVDVEVPGVVGLEVPGVVEAVGTYAASLRFSTRETLRPPARAS
jgi:hypothetical protein